MVEIPGYMEYSMAREYERARDCIVYLGNSKKAGVVGVK